MKFWIDAQLRPAMAKWLPEMFAVESATVRSLGHGQMPDAAVFERTRRAGEVVVTKDSDFIDIVHRLDPPPQILWITCGNVTNSALRDLFQRGFPQALALLQAGEPVVELGEKSID